MKVKNVFAALFLALSFGIAWGQSTPERTVEAAPGVPLPSRGGLYALEFGENKQLIKLAPSEVLLNRHTGKNMTKGLFYVGSRMTLEIAGTTTKNTIHSDEISFFYHLNSDQPSLDLSRLVLLKLEPSGEVRVLAALDANVFGGGAKRKIQQIEAKKEELPGEEWLKITPAAKLAPGDYAFTLLPKDPKLFPDSAFDFRVDLGR